MSAVGRRLFLVVRAAVRVRYRPVFYGYAGSARLLLRPSARLAADYSSMAFVKKIFGSKKNKGSWVLSVRWTINNYNCQYILQKSQKNLPKWPTTLLTRPKPSQSTTRVMWKLQLLLSADFGSRRRSLAASPGF